MPLQRAAGCRCSRQRSEEPGEVLLACRPARPGRVSGRVCACSPPNPENWGKLYNTLPQARAKVPDALKAELLRKIKAALEG